MNVSGNVGLGIEGDVHMNATLPTSNVHVSSNVDGMGGGIHMSSGVGMGPAGE